MRIYVLISYDSKNGGINTIFSQLTKVQEMTPDVEKQIRSLLGVSVTDAEGTIKSLKITDESVQNLVHSMADSQTVYNNADDAMDAYQRQLQNTGKGLDLATIKTKALSASMKLLSSIGWMLAITAITEAVQLLVTTLNNIQSIKTRKKIRHTRYFYPVCPIIKLPTNLLRCPVKIFHSFSALFSSCLLTFRSFFLPCFSRCSLLAFL